jgi:hemerythrin-like domain-containing protein
MPIRIGQRPDHGFDEPLGLLSDCHRRIEYFLQVLIAIADQVNGGPCTATQGSQLDGALTYFATAAPRHTADEEESLFPRLRASDAADVQQALDLLGRLERDHVAANEHHQAVDSLGRRWLTNGWLTASDVQHLRTHLLGLQQIYQGHILAEDQEIFPTARRLLAATELREMGREMAARRSFSPDQTHP